MSKENFQIDRELFIRGLTAEAAELGATEEKIASMAKLAFSEDQLNNEDVITIKKLLQDRGTHYHHGLPNNAPASYGYNSELLRARDSLANKDPDIEALKGGLRYGVPSAVAGGFAGHHMGINYNKTSLPEYRSANLPSRLRIGGAALGGLLGGAYGAVKRHHQTESAHKLNDPQNLQALAARLAQERQFTGGM